ncbi:MAG: hypothetical protein C0402_06035 [Thermodesulfovibrio sp.]|nr:hypothetical protein [Thermodesulfovibrio sp.]
MNDTIFISLINNAALLLSLGMIYDIFYRGKRVALPALNQAVSGLIIGVIAIVLMATPARWESGIIFDTRTILLGLTGLFFGTIPAILAMAIAGAYRLNLGGGGALMGVATIISSGVIGLAWRYYRFRASREVALSELYLFGTVVHTAMIVCMFLLPQEVIRKTISTLALPVIIIYPVCTALLGNLLAGRLRRYRIEEDLQDSVQRFNQLAEQSLTVTWEIDASGLYTYVSPVAESVFGYRPEELIGKMHFYDIHPEKGREEFKRAAFAIIRSSVETDNLVNAVQTKNGRIIWVSTNGSPLLAKDGTLRGYRGLDRDVTERRVAEEALKDSEKKYRSLFEESRDMIFISTYDGRFIDVNPAFVSRLGYSSKEDLVSVTISDIYMHPDDRILYLKLLEKNGFVIDFETTLLCRDGQQVHVSVNAAAIRDELGTIAVIRGIIRDITEHRKLEDQLRQAQRMESIGTLAGGVAHDFNNILSAIMGYGHLTLMKMAADDPHRRNIEQMLEASDRAAHLTKDLLLFSRKQAIDRKPVDLNQLIMKVENFVMRVIGEDIACKLTLSGDKLTILADLHQIEQVLMNLAANARDAMITGGALTVETEQIMLDDTFQGIAKPGAYAMITVSDTGKGMRRETSEHIFEPFYTTKEVGKGTGLGLAVVYGIIKQHEGHITVYSEPGIGTTFKIYLPLIASREGGEKTPAAAVNPVGGTETILLAEDNESVRNLTESVLKEFGYTVIIAVDGDDAVSKFIENKDRVQLLFSDLIMPKKSGKEVYDHIRQLRPDIKVIFASGYSPDIIRDKTAIGSGVVIINKPIAPMDLLKKIRSVLDEGGI